MLVDVADHLADRRSSSTPKKAVAPLRIGARRSSRFSRSSSLIRSRSSVVRRLRLSPSISAWVIHLRRDSGPIPSATPISGDRRSG